MQIQEKTNYIQIKLPEKILSFLKQQNGFGRFFRESTFSVTEISSCKRKTFFKKSRHPQEEMILDNISDLWSSVRGNFLHQMTSVYSWNELEGSTLITLDDGKEITLCGRLDMYDHDTKTIIDLKTIGDVKKQSQEGLLPKKEHVLQILAYYTIFSQIISVEHLNLVYADMNNLIAYEIPIGDISKWIQSRVSEIQRSVNSGTAPQGEVSSNCRFCRFQTACTKIPGGLTDTPKSAPKFFKSKFM